uniref:HAT C-terminal dimerisation domain-containing protein n=1 Tax=Cacopsylla melanoneura TaxID=428564 RepID=A0A8D9FE05_9HEMI
MKYVQEYDPNAMADLLKYRAQTAPFHAYLFTPESTIVKPVVWWMSQKRWLHEGTNQLAEQLCTAVASSAGIERLFSTFGLVLSRVRNRLGTEKAAKLVTIFRGLNQGQ